MKKYLIVLAVICFMPLFSSAQSDFELNFNGDHAFIFHMPVTEEGFDFDGNIKVPRFENELGFEIKYKIIKLIVKWDIDLRVDRSGKIENIVFVRPDENYLSISPWKFRIDLGYQKISWGVGDGINPTDNINSKDYSRGINDNKMANLMASVMFFPHDIISLQTVYVPFFQKNVLYNNISFPDEMFSPVSGKNVSFNEPDFDFKSFIIGEKVNFYVPYVDFSFSYLYTTDPFYTPEIEVDMVQVAPPYPIYAGFVKKLDLVHKRIHNFGTDIKITAGIFGIWMELNYAMTEDYLMNQNNLRNHKFSWGAGFDFNYGPNDDYYFNLQYFGEWMPGFDVNFYKDFVDGNPELNKDKSYYEDFYYRSLTDKLGGQNEGLNQALSLNMKWKLLNSIMTPELTLIYNIPLLYDYDREIKYGGLYMNPLIDFMPIDDFHIIIGSVIYLAWHKMNNSDVELDTGNPIGNYKNETSVYIEIRYKWNIGLRK